MPAARWRSQGFRDVAICTYEPSYVQIAISQKRHFRSPNRKIPENRPPQSTPQNPGELTSETTFGHSKVVFQPLLRTKRAFSQKMLARFFCFLATTQPFLV